MYFSPNVWRNVFECFVKIICSLHFCRIAAFTAGRDHMLTICSCSMFVLILTTISTLKQNQSFKNWNASDKYSSRYLYHNWNNLQYLALKQNELTNLFYVICGHISIIMHSFLVSPQWTLHKSILKLFSLGQIWDQWFGEVWSFTTRNIFLLKVT